MRASRKIPALLALSASLALAACGDSGGADADGDGEITQAEVIAEMADGPAVRMRPGQWEQTFEFTEVDIPGMPAEAKEMMQRQMGSSFTTKACLTEADVEQPDPEFFGGQQNDDCTYDKFERSGDTMEMAMTCEAGNGGVTTIAMTGTFGEDEYSMEMDNKVSGTPMGDMTMKGKMTARRLGDCP